MKNLMLIACFVFTWVTGVAAREDSVHSIVRGTDGEPHLVKFNSGAVEFVEANDEAKLGAYEKKIKTVETNLQNKFLIRETNFEPTVIPDSMLQTIFDRMNPFMRRKSECSDRAHVWAYDEYQKSGIKSEKAFLMLTDTYIRRHRYKWWFHVAPMYTTESGRKMVMDFQFIDRPVTFTQWKNSLVFTKRECVTDFRFLDYNAGADQTQDCYVKFEPMYYYIPADIGNREKGGGKTGWSTGEVNGARARAFFKGSI